MNDNTAPTLQPPRAYFEALATAGVLPESEAGGSPPSREVKPFKPRARNYPALAFEDPAEHRASVRALQPRESLPPFGGFSSRQLDDMGTAYGPGVPRVISPQRDAKARPLYSADERIEQGQEDGVAPWDASSGPQVDDSEDLAALLDEYPLTRAEREVTELVLDGRPIFVEGSGFTTEFLPLIAEHLGITHEAVRARWSRARRKLTTEADSNGLYRYWVLVQDTRRGLSQARTRV